MDGRMLCTELVSHVQQCVQVGPPLPQFQSVINPVHSEGSIFDADASPWDRVFEDLDNTPVAITGAHRPGGTHGHRVGDNPRSRAPKRHTMTAREVRAFDDMFNMLFAAVSEQSSPSAGTPSLRPMTAASGVGIGRSLAAKGGKAGDLIVRLRKHTRAMRWTSQAEQTLDRKKEEMELCDSDQQLLQWAMREVFGESRRYEEASRRALELAGDNNKDQDVEQLQPPTYPYLLALLMKTFRDKYADPHLALSVFDHARHLSIPSYVFGCTTPAYNELIETRWRCFRDLRGVCEALEEMCANGVDMDTRTRTLAEMIRREVGERNLWQEESAIGSGEAMDMIVRIEKLTMRKPKRDMRGGNGPKSRSRAAVNEVWKANALQEDNTKDGWEFGNWENATMAQEQMLELR
ncbi:hypothetical protein OBBRIDRAFT_799008 [Obba rivulosa]|uniref:Mtf2-like C-terminal domain-containing protein n=1 Tax=Obba rivulosa TaxID=1052685 RepID=A0A8E2ASP4_9APHY|nr:hypothetical protein OBBRIDRAFT_799008 [Obba rivulosa]